jgi:hypothetical protein
MEALPLTVAMAKGTAATLKIGLLPQNHDHEAPDK